jgi:hypothetical protein
MRVVGARADPAVGSRTTRTRATGDGCSLNLWRWRPQLMKTKPTRPKRTGVRMLTNRHRLLAKHLPTIPKRYRLLRAEYAQLGRWPGVGRGMIPLSGSTTLPESVLRVKFVSGAVQSAELKAPAPSTGSGSYELPAGWTERGENTVAARDFGENQYETFARIQLQKADESASDIFVPGCRRLGIRRAPAETGVRAGSETRAAQSASEL